jgi:hypothetical protein
MMTLNPETSGGVFAASGQKLSPAEAAGQEENRKKTGSFTPPVPLDKKAAHR